MILANPTLKEIRAAVEAITSEWTAEASRPRSANGMDLLQSVPFEPILAETQALWERMSGTREKRTLDVIVGLQWGLCIGATIQASRMTAEAFGGDAGLEAEASAETPCAECEGSGRAWWLGLIRTRCGACGGRGVRRG